VFAIARELELPVRFVGTGEGLDDLALFDPDAFTRGLFE
jgi:fused signal recognition particle receptor